ncbi:hypothetical protein [Arthrobacter crystallopoietes]|uniref:hypothetical protein n=1 Tax=Crystallibacter crystallopoietes TaxID=37928 RepID=UPI00111105BA|nr:hypothetical protein [Arthrobacter crystallopoietes]
MDIETASAADIYRHLLDVQDRLNELVSEDRLTLERDAEQTHGTAQRAVEQINSHLDEARQILAWIETRD